MLIQNWKMSYMEHKNLACRVPCSMYSVLLEHGKIEDPFYGVNDGKYTALSDNDCTFEAEFEAKRELVQKEYVELEFLGLDTICEIFLNGKKIAETKNMHRAYVYDIKDKIKEGINTLRLEFKSPTAYFKYMENKHHLYNTEDALPGAAHLRKALCMSGWDWGPQLPDMGIFRNVKINAYDTDKIDSVGVCQKHSENSVDLKIKLETLHGSDCVAYAHIDGQKAVFEDGECNITVKNPKLWWVRGYGEQYLYDLTVTIEKDGVIVDEKTEKIGLRTLSVSTAPDEDGQGSEFCFVLNGVKIFAMGANYIPQDNLLSRINPERTKKLIHMAADANFNCLRVWGGGYYPEDEFYDICDSYGIFIWQDFMVACANVWLRKEFKQECIEEAIYNLKRFRNHASLGLLCGNNEMEEGVVNWDSTGESMLTKIDYLELYEHILPDICEELAPDTYYWPASPSSGGGFEDPTCDSRGDVHFWKVWHGGVPFTEYRKHKFRFCSEYGFESYPSMKTIRSFCEEKDLNCFSRVVENHQKCKAGNTKILMYLADNYLYPYSFEKLVYASQLLQADAIKYGVEHFRRNRGYTMGSIYWQFNDCWPVASWSSVDYYGRYKALHYAAKKFYAPVAMGLFLEKNTLTVNISNETMSGFEGEIKICKCDSRFNEISCTRQSVCVDSLSSKDVFDMNVSYDNKYSEYIYADLYDKDGKLIMRQTELLVKPKHFLWEKPEIKISMTDCEGGVCLKAESDVFAKGVYIDFDCDVTMSDNFFDIADKNGYTVKLETELSAKELEKSIKVMSVYDIGE